MLYEGYVLYPYRASALKNRTRLTFGILYPEAWAAGHGPSDRSHFQMECLLRGKPDSRVSLLVRFLQLISGEGQEREVTVDFDLGGPPCRRDFSFPTEISGSITTASRAIASDLYRLSVVVRNTAPLETGDRDLALARSLASAHAALTIADGSFISLTDPPPEMAEEAARCKNVGVWPVLVGDEGATDTLLASPIILPDYPEVAPESAGDLCDSTEIDEILTLRILTLTEEEKAEVRNSETRARAILERAESIPAEHLMRLHGTIREP